MSKHYLQALILTLFSAGILAQAPNPPILDSLANELKTAKPDTQRVKTLTLLGWNLINVGMFDSSRVYLEEALALADQLSFRTYKVKIMNIYGVSYFYEGNTDEALKYWEPALELAEETGDIRSAAKLRTNLGNAQQAYGNYPAALDMYLKILPAYETLNDSATLGMTYGNIGVLYGQMKEFDKAELYIKKSLAISQDRKDKLQQARDLTNLANIFVYTRKYAPADSSLQLALAICKEIQNYPALSQTLMMMGNLHMEQFHLGEAMDYLNQSNDILVQLGDDYTLATNQGRLSVIILDMLKPEHKAYLDKYFGGDRNKALNAAHAKVDSSLAVMKAYGNLEDQKVAYQVLSQVYEAKGDFAKALETFAQFKMLSDSLLNIERDKKVTQTAMQYEFDKKEAIAKAEQEKKDTRQATIRNSIGGGLLGALVFLFVVVRQRNRISKEKQRSEELLLNILPAEVAEELKAKGSADARHFDKATILFTDFRNFTELAEKLSPAELVEELNACFKTFDGIMQEYRVEKIKTIGDAYMAVGGVPDTQSGSPIDVVRAALTMQDFMHRHKAERESAGKPFFEMRIGIHTGSVVAGIVGVKKFQYDIWGDTVNMASRMESAGEAGKVNISEDTYEEIWEVEGLSFTHRGKIAVKGKGEVNMWFVENKEHRLA